jgi:type II pantothenate kinase
MSPHASSTQPELDPTAAGQSGKSATDISDGSRPRRTTVASQSAIEETILHPGTVRINVQGAFIVDDEHEPSTPQSEDYEHDPRDIRLPNHTAVVSHIAVDVSQHSF